MEDYRGDMPQIEGMSLICKSCFKRITHRPVVLIFREKKLRSSFTPHLAPWLCAIRFFLLSLSGFRIPHGWHACPSSLEMTFFFSDRKIRAPF
ncbi:uncharacterized protein LOC142503729 isoform X2 [Ascaphus truei]|uniref:uncharacterized protein LOC142503729 isoform X2 n=1 Tax=Ascaphus truei TaxID=8439 RepID=UPI003F5ADD5F